MIAVFRCYNSRCGHGVGVDQYGGDMDDKREQPLREHPLSGKKDIPLSPWQGMEMDPFPGNAFEWQESEKADRWSVSWSDLMMTMFILFVILYVYQAGNRELEFGPGPGDNYISDQGSGRIADVNIQKQPSDIYDQAREAIHDEFVKDSASVELVPEKAVRIVLAGDLLFDLGRADLKTEARWRLRQLARVLNENSFVINVIGHTDDMPNHSRQYPTNWELSTARACAVARYLIEEEGVEEDRFFVSGYSWHRPLVPNTTAHNRSLNRRVEIILMKEMPYAGGAAIGLKAD